MFIETDFDKPLEEDVVFEETDTANDTKTLLKNSENLLKSFLYLKEMFSSSPTFNKIIKIDYFDGVSDEEINVSPEANLIVFKNGKDDSSNIYYNDNDKLVLHPYEQMDFPYSEGDCFKVGGTLNVIQMKYEIR